MAYRVHSIQEGEKCQRKGSDFGPEGSEQEELEGTEGGGQADLNKRKRRKRRYVSFGAFHERTRANDKSRLGFWCMANDDMNCSEFSSLPSFPFVVSDFCLVAGGITAGN